MIDEFIHDHVLKHFYGYELMMTPYALAHLKMKSLLDKNNYSLGLPRSRILLVNALDTKNIRTKQSNLTEMSMALTQEAVCASKVNNRDEIIAVIGNPPYSVSSSNKGMLNKEMDLYKAGVKSEKSIMALSDDYIKFIRLAHKQIDDQEKGVIGFITNNSYLGGLIHRGMREELMKSFNEIYILNLHGHAGVDPKGDKNVFDIKQGVSIAIFVKNPEIKERKVYYSELIGSREYKYDYLDSNSIIDTKWSELDSCKPYFFFEPKDFSGKETYDEFLSVDDIFNERSPGITTSRDEFAVRNTGEDVYDVVNDFVSLDVESAREKYNLHEDTSGWNVESAQDDIKNSGVRSELIKPILYRPFDTKYTYYTGKAAGFMSRPRRDVMQHMMHDNIGLLTSRRERGYGICHTYVCKDIVEYHTIPNGTYVCPLYLYTNGSKKPNITSSIITKLTTAYGTEPTPEDIFYYIYGILYSTTYRTKYAEFLKIDFPKIPFTTDHELFMKIGSIGKQLTDLHLMKQDVFNTSTIKYCGRGDNKVDKISYDEENHRVSINKNQYFDSVSKEVWEYQIGGYIVMQKWLKDRMHDVLNQDDVNHYRYIGEALEKTIELQNEIDEMYDDVENGEIINLSQKFVELTDYTDQ